MYNIKRVNNTIQEWEDIAQLNSVLKYDDDYVFSQMPRDELSDRFALNYPVNFDFYSGYKEEGSRLVDWPAFMIDLIPSGAGRRTLIKKYQRDDENFLLSMGARNSIGNLRVESDKVNDLEISESTPLLEEDFFTRENIIAKKEDFIDIAEKNGVKVSGATDVVGDAPKFLVAQLGTKDLFYPDNGGFDKIAVDYR